MATVRVIGVTVCVWSVVGSAVVGGTVKGACKVGCTGCGLCSKPKITPSESVTMVDNVPTFGAEWEDFQMAVEKCPGTCFVVKDVEEET